MVESRDIQQRHIFSLCLEQNYTKRIESSNARLANMELPMLHFKRAHRVKKARSFRFKRWLLTEETSLYMDSLVPQTECNAFHFEHNLDGLAYIILSIHSQKPGRQVSSLENMKDLARTDEKVYVLFLTGKKSTPCFPSVFCHTL